jgi:hypothetical protein
MSKMNWNDLDYEAQQTIIRAVVKNPAVEHIISEQLVPCVLALISSIVDIYEEETT